MREFDPVSLEIIWSRLLNVTEEMWTTILRTAVSTIIASANDFGCEIMDAEGRSIAHAYRSMPVFNMTMPNVTKEILKKYPANTLKPGDVFLTNDPWLCAGHLPDIAVVTPIFFQGRFVGFAGESRMRVSRSDRYAWWRRAPTPFCLATPPRAAGAGTCSARRLRPRCTSSCPGRRR